MSVPCGCNSHVELVTLEKKKNENQDGRQFFPRVLRVFPTVGFGGSCCREPSRGSRGCVVTSRHNTKSALPHLWLSLPLYLPSSATNPASHNPNYHLPYSPARYHLVSLPFHPPQPLPASPATPPTRSCCSQLLNPSCWPQPLCS